MNTPAYRTRLYSSHPFYARDVVALP